MDMVGLDVSRVEDLARDPGNSVRMAWNLQQVPVNGTTYLVADAKYLNKYTNQRGRGNLRILIDRDEYKYAGLALEVSGGSYRQVA